MTTLDIIRKTKAAWSALRDADAETKNRLLTAMADSLVDHTAEILTCNETGPHFRCDAGPAAAG